MCLLEAFRPVTRKEKNNVFRILSHFGDLVYVNFFSCNRLCQSKQSKVYLPEAPFPHAEVPCLSVNINLYRPSTELYALLKCFKVLIS